MGAGVGGDRKGGVEKGSKLSADPSGSGGAQPSLGSDRGERSEAPEAEAEYLR